MVSMYRPTRRVRTMDRMLQERARHATQRSGRRALATSPYTFADSQRIATANGLITQAARAGYPNTGFLPYGDQHYPAMERVEPGKVPLQPVGATGTQIFAGIIAEDSEYNPDFYWRDKIDVYEKMRRNDGQVKAVERAIMQPIKSTEWYIKPASTSARDQEIAALVESCMFKDRIYRTTEGRLIKQSWQQVLHHILLFLPMGFSVMAKWFYMDDQDFAKWARWEPMLQKTIWRWWVGADTELTGIQQRAFLDYQIQFLDVAIERLLVFIHEQEGNNFDGTSILRSAYKHWYFKENFYKLQAITVERTATLPPIATLAPEVQSDAMANAVMTQLQNMRVSEAMGITVPAGVAIEFPRNYQRGESEADRAIEHHDAMIARSVLADFLNLGTGSNTGSYSLADVKAELFIQCEEGHCKALENVINTDAIPELVNYNYDGVDVYPELVHRPIAKADLKDVAQLFTAGALTQDPEMQDFVRNLLGAPLAPRNVVQSTNPTSPASPPEGGEQAPMEQGKKADATSDQGDDTATGDGGAGGDAGAAGMSEGRMVEELRDTARLFAEAASAISGVDVVERGLTFFNPNHGPNGRFTYGSGGAAGGSSGSGKGGHGAEDGSGGSGGASAGGSGHEEARQKRAEADRLTQEANAKWEHYQHLQRSGASSREQDAAYDEWERAEGHAGRAKRAASEAEQRSQSSKDASAGKAPREQAERQLEQLRQAHRDALAAGQSLRASDLKRDIANQENFLHYTNGDPNGTTAFYHVVGPEWESGQPLVGRDELMRQGVSTAWKWGDDAPEGFDGDGVSLHASRAEAETFQHEYGGRILRVQVPNSFVRGDKSARADAADEWNGRSSTPYHQRGSDGYSPYFTRNQEGYPFVAGFVPQSWIHEDGSASQMAEPPDTSTTVRLYNPNHDARGRFAPGGAGGASGGSGGRSSGRGEGGARGGGRSGGSRSSAGKSEGGASGGSGGAGSRSSSRSGGTRSAKAAKKTEDERETAAKTAKTHVHYATEHDRAAVRNVFGRSVSDAELAGMVGAHNGERVDIESTGKSRFFVQAKNDHYEATFEIRKAGKSIIAEGDVETTQGERSARSGREILRAMGHMRQMGVTKVIADASRAPGSNGYYTWARLGFTGRIPGHVLGAAQARFGKVTTVQALMKKAGGPAWWKEHGDTWHATFDFSKTALPGSGEASA